jgi:transcriptional regulator with XRE-family HTH domain
MGLKTYIHNQCGDLLYMRKGGNSMNLKSIRIQKGLSRKELAEKLNVALNTVWRWENGERTPDLGTIRTLATLLDCSIDNLIGDGNPTEAAEVEK